jgi:hypothetical protein
VLVTRIPKLLENLLGENTVTDSRERYEIKFTEKFKIGGMENGLKIFILIHHSYGLR